MNDLIGKKIENYHIVSVLGKGGMGVVYKAIDEKLNRKVAIKVLNSSQIANKAHVIERFRSEARNHAQLLHPNIVTVYGFLEFDNQFAIVMEYVEGESLEKVILRNKRLHIYDIVYITLQLLEGIGYAHSKGYIHRDIKPSNIIVNSEGIVKIMDFGISKSLYEDTPRTKTGARIGTIYYMSPEQIKGQPITPLTDIYSIGCTVYEMITGLPPFFSQNEFDVMDGHLHKEVIPVFETTPELSAELNRVLGRLLSKDPTKRYQSCNETIIAFHFLDQFLKESESDYFEHKKRKRILSRKKSIIGFSFLIIIFLALVIFVFFQVKDFMKNRGYSIFEDGNAAKIAQLDIDSSLVLSEAIALGTGLSLKSGFLNGAGGIIVGDSGLVVSYNSRTKTWEKESFKERVNFTDCCITTSGEYYIVGENSTCISGNPYRGFVIQSVTSEDYTFFGVDFNDHMTGIIVGNKGIILRHSDEGDKWGSIHESNFNSLFDFQFVNNKTGFAVGMNGTIIRTDDLGMTWSEIKSNTNKYLKSISFLDDNTGLIVGGGGTVLKTADGGDNWQLLKSISNSALNKVRFINKDLILIVGNHGTVLTSKDLGENWSLVEPKYFNNWNDILIGLRNNIYLLGDNGKFVELKRGEM